MLTFWALSENFAIQIFPGDDQVSTARKPIQSEKPRKNPLFALLNEQLFQLAGTAKNPKLSGAPQLFALMFVSAETMSISRTPGEDAPEWSRPLTLQEFAKRCGCAKATVWRILTDAEARGLIESVGKTDGRRKDLSAAQKRGVDLPWGTAHVQAKRYRLTPATWKTAKAWVPTAADVPAIELEEETAADVPAIDKPAASSTMTLQAGKSRPLKFEAPAQGMVVTCHDQPVRVERGFREGTVFLDIFAVNKAVKEGTVYLQVYGGNSGHSASLRDKLIAELADRGLAVEASMASRLLKLAAPCNDLDFFLHVLDDKIQTMRSKRMRYTVALLPTCAQDVKTKWVDVRRARAKVQAAMDAAGIPGAEGAKEQSGERNPRKESSTQATFPELPPDLRQKAEAELASINEQIAELVRKVKKNQAKGADVVLIDKLKFRRHQCRQELAQAAHDA